MAHSNDLKANGQLSRLFKNIKKGTNQWCLLLMPQRKLS